MRLCVYVSVKEIVFAKTGKDIRQPIKFGPEIQLSAASRQ